MINVRPATINDIEETTRLGNSVWRSAYAHIMPAQIFDEKDAQLNEKIILHKERFANRDAKDVYYIAEDTNANRIVGFAIGNYNAFHGQHFSNQNCSEIMAFYILPEYQNRGIGRKIFDTISADFKKLGSTKMVIGVLEQNTQARAAYEKYGGKLDTYRRFYETCGQRFPEVFYTYDL
jgi:GNAT superfamily N-acetyltransferase